MKEGALEKCNVLLDDMEKALNLVLESVRTLGDGAD
jgi:hypothetical protein